MSNTTTDPEHVKFMQLALAEARKSVYIPSAFCVGAVITSSTGEVIATGFSRELEGNTHAEQCALDKLSLSLGADEAARQLVGASIYTTMEPCSVRLSGNLPCVQRILATGIKKVYQGVAEPADFVACEGTNLLRDSGVEVCTVEGFEEDALKVARGEAAA